MLAAIPLRMTGKLAFFLIAVSPSLLVFGLLAYVVAEQVR
jgi:hypothetical protein